MSKSQELIKAQAELTEVLKEMERADYSEMLRRHIGYNTIICKRCGVPNDVLLEAAGGGGICRQCT